MGLFLHELMQSGSETQEDTPNKGKADKKDDVLLLLLYSRMDRTSTSHCSIYLYATNPNASGLRTTRAKPASRRRRITPLVTPPLALLLGSPT